MRAIQTGCLFILLATTPTFAVPIATEPLRGTAYQADGKPAGGAIVWAARFDYGPLDRVETVADDSGRFELKLGVGTWKVWARLGTQGGEIATRSGMVDISSERAPDAAVIRLEECGTLRGRLTESETGKPIAGGQLFLDVAVVLATNADGRFEIGGLRRTRHESFVVAPGRMRMRVLFDTTARADTDLEIPVPVGGKIVGRVTDLDGKPIIGAQVGRHTSGSYFSINALFQACRPDGRFEYDDAVELGQPTRLTASAPGHVSVERQGTMTAEGKPLEFDFRLRPNPDPEPKGTGDKRRIVSGVVLGPNAAPQPGVLVRWGYQPHLGAIQMRTDEGGRFKLTVPDEAGMLAVQPRQFLPEFPQVAAAGDKELVVRLRTGTTARGRVTDDTGKPIKDVYVVASIPSPDPRIGNPFWLSEVDCRTDADGKFEMFGLPETARLDFLKAGLTEQRFQPIKLGGADNQITMQYGGAVKAKALDRNGKPIRNFRVTVGFPQVRQANERTDGFFAGYSGMGVRFTSDDGEFVLTGVGAGSVYRITVLAEGHGEAVVDRVTAVPLNRLGATPAIVIQAGAPIAFRVKTVATDGKPIAGARVTLVNGEPGLDQSFTWGYDDASWNNMARARSAIDGWANFPALNFGGATVIAQAPGFARQRVGWRLQQKEIPLALAPEAILTGMIRDATGEPIKECYITLESGGDRISTSVDGDASGKFRITELPAGDWNLVVRGADGISAIYNAQVALKAGETKSISITTK